jgi:WD40 repeat protein
VRLWNAETGKEIKNLGMHANSVYCVAFSPDGKRLATGSADMTVKIWDVPEEADKQKEYKTLKGPTGLITGMAWGADGTLVTVSQDRVVRIWDIEGGKEAKTMEQEADKKDDLYGVAFSPDGKSLATSGYAGWVTVWDLAEGKPTWSKKLSAPLAFCAAFSPDGKYVVTGHEIPGKSGIVLITPVGAP